MSGIQFSSPVTNQKASPAIYASSLATRPAALLPGRIFVDTDNPSTGIYRDTGTAWVQIASASGGSLTLQQVTDNGNITDNTLILTYDSTFNGSNAIEFFDTGTTATRYSINKLGTGNRLTIQGNSPLSTYDMGLMIDAINNTIKTYYGSSFNENGIKLDFGTSLYQFGKIDNPIAGNRGIAVDSNGSVGIGTASMNSSAILHLSSSTKGFLPPSLTSVQKNAMSTPASGLIVYQSDGTNGLYVYDNSVWNQINTGAKFANYVVQCLSTANWADSTTYHFGAVPQTTSTTQGSQRGVFNQSGTITSVYLFVRSLANASTESITLKLYKATGAGALSQIGSTSFAFTGVSSNPITVAWTGLSLAVSANDTYEFSVDIPVMATNPTSVFISGYIKVEYL